MQDSNKQRELTGESPLPLVRLNLLLPFLEALDRLRLNTDAVLTANGLVRETVHDADVFVPVIVIHRFLEDAARAASNPYFGVHVGETLDLSRWSPFVDAVSRARMLGDFLIRFIRAVPVEASSARHELEVGASHASFKEIRATEQEIAPAQNDAFTAAFTLGILRRGAGKNWKAEDVRLKVCDWLLQPLDRRALVPFALKGTHRSQLPVEFLDALRQTLLPHLHQADLNVDYAAHLTGLSRQSLQRKLKASATTFSAEVIELKKRRAAEDLVHTNNSIANIASSLGFTNPTSFTRAFRSWTGESPRHYRKRHRGH